MTALLACVFVGLGVAAKAAQPPVVQTVDRVWAAHPVEFALARAADAVFVAYFDAERRMTVASRPASGGTFIFQKLDSVTGWDSHNYIALALDLAGHVHVIGNMHNEPLVYFRSTRPGDVRSMQRVPVLVDVSRERRMTYPVFIKDSGNRLFLKYRDGGSGNGNEVYNVYDAETRTWRALLRTPLVDGEQQRNAYFVGPAFGPDGFFHLAWVWRETPDAETNHDLSYARSRDLVSWETSGGAAFKLPITLGSAEIVDPVPVGGGMINNNTVVGFDTGNRPVITYHKFDARGDTQIHLARRGTHGWTITQLTRWRNFRWDFRGRGSLESRVRILHGAIPASRATFVVQVQRDGQALDLLVDSRRLRLIRETRVRSLSDKVAQYFDTPPDMVLNAVTEKGDNRGDLVLAWPTLPPNRDQPRTNIPPPSELKLIQYPSVRMMPDVASGPEPEELSHAD